jgi:hypothetical protein
MAPAAELPDCDDVWKRFFARWYRHEDLRVRPYPATRPDADCLLEPGTSAAAATRLTDAGIAKVAQQLERMRGAVLEDWPSYLDVEPPLGIHWIAAFDAHWTRSRVRDVLERSDPSDFSNELVVFACELGVALAEVMRIACPDLEWLYDWPYWESRLLDVPTGYTVNVFDWGIKRFSEYGIEDGYVAKTGRVIELIRAGWST